VERVVEARYTSYFIY